MNSLRTLGSSAHARIGTVGKLSAELIIGSAAAIGAALALAASEASPIARAGILALILFAAWRAGSDGRARAIAYGAGLGAIGYLGITLLQLSLQRIEVPPFWDFTVYWLIGKVAAAGGPAYDPVPLLELGRTIGAPDSFFAEGRAFYPPPSLLMFAPLGLLSLSAASAAWYLVQLNALIVCVFFAWYVLLRREGLLGLVIVSSAILLMPSTEETISLGQTNFLLLGAAIACFLPGNRWGTGVAIALGSMVKPYFGAMVLAPVLRGQWRVVLGLAITLGIAALVTIAALGPGVVGDFLTNGIHNLSAYPYTQEVNQSLTATLRRWTGALSKEAEWLVTVVAIVVVIGIGRVLLALRLAGDRVPDALITGIVLTTALMMYPGTIAHYYVLLVVPWLALWEMRNRLPISIPAMILAMAASWFFLGVDRGYLAVVSAAITIATLCLIGALMAGRETPTEDGTGAPDQPPRPRSDPTWPAPVPADVSAMATARSFARRR